ncbi:hypothetical protein K523DRAFT_379926 [Schizophyllum commune Tattone D]|nr:hypothetical protein K523DRAFT_379926 [Schizophyllum commune Tattone D]
MPHLCRTSVRLAASFTTRGLALYTTFACSPRCRASICAPKGRIRYRSSISSRSLGADEARSLRQRYRRAVAIAILAECATPLPLVSLS